jgi:hypothetical protein
MWVFSALILAVFTGRRRVYRDCPRLLRAFAGRASETEPDTDPNANANADPNSLGLIMFVIVFMCVFFVFISFVEG